MPSFLIARQRSGTGALGSVLDRHPALKYVGEILHPNDRANPVNFFRFLEAQSLASAFALMPDARKDIVQTFFDATQALHPDRQVIYDLKYNSLHHWNGGWQGILQEPWLIRHAKAGSLPILHLTRSNLVETFVSGRLAELNQVWHARDRQEVKVSSLAVNPVQLRRYLDSTTREIEQVRRWLGRYERCLEIEYAETFDATGRMQDEVAARLAAFLGIDALPELNPAFVKQAPAKLSAAIENFEEVRTALSGTPYARMVAED